MRIAERYRSPLGRAMATKYAGQIYVSDRFLNRAAALEGFDRIRTSPGTVTLPIELGNVSISLGLSLSPWYTIQQSGPQS